MKYEILEHKADLKIRAFGKNLKELFENAMIGMQNAIRAEVKSPYKVEPSGFRQKSKGRNIKIKSSDLSSLLVDFLSKINYLNEVNKEVYNSIRFVNFSHHGLEGEISGEKVENFGLIIKGVTYHDLDIRQRKDKTWEVTILFDI
jgi:SHS2 domain-containing protein